MAEPLYRSVIWLAKGLFAGLGLRIDVVGADHVPLTGGAVLAINHTSYLDFALAGIPADQRGRRLVRFMAKDGIFRHPVAGPLMRGMRHIPVDRSAGAAAYAQAVTAVRSGELVGVFPEATMSRSLRIQSIKSGAVRMALDSGAPLIPMIVYGGHRILSYDTRDLTRGRPIAITVGEPLDLPRDIDEGTGRMRALEEGTSRMRALEEGTGLLHERMTVLLDRTVARYPDPDSSHAS